MNVNIQNSDEFVEAIDAYGEVTAKIKELQKEAKLAKSRLEYYAEDNGIIRKNAKKYRLTMKKAPPALRIQSGVKEEDVVALLKESEVGRDYVVSTFDFAALKRDFGSTKAGKKQLELFGLMLTETNRHAEVALISERR